jgi:hypothetical protein
MVRKDRGGEAHETPARIIFILLWNTLAQAGGSPFRRVDWYDCGVLRTQAQASTVTMAA